MLKEEKDKISQLENRLEKLNAYQIEIESIKSEINKIHILKTFKERVSYL